MRELHSSPWGCHSLCLVWWRHPFEWSLLLGWKRTAPHLWLLVCPCVQVVQNTKFPKWSLELSNWAIILQSGNSYLCSGLSMSVLVCASRAWVHFQKKQRRDAPTLNCFRVMRTTGSINKRKVRRNGKSGKYCNKLLTPLYLDCLYKHSLKKLTKPHFQKEAMKLFYWHSDHIKRTFPAFSWGFVF